MAKPLPKIPQGNGRLHPKPLPKIPQGINQGNKKLSPKALPEIPQRKPTIRPQPVAVDEDNAELIQGLNPDQINELAQKVVLLWRAEMRLEAERLGRNSFR